MMKATLASGHRLPNQETAPAAKITATLPMASLRLHSQTERILLSPVRNPNMSAALITFATSANVPNQSHHHGTRHTTLHQIPDGTAEHPKPERGHRGGLKHRCPGTPTEARCQYHQTDDVTR